MTKNVIRKLIIGLLAQEKPRKEIQRFVCLPPITDIQSSIVISIKIIEFSSKFFGLSDRCLTGNQNLR